MQNWIFRASTQYSVHHDHQKSFLHADLVLNKHLLLLITVEKSCAA